MAFNLGPKTVCCLHRDFKNVAHGLCPVTSAGSYDPRRGGHMVLWEFRLIIEFPPRTTILIPSATIGHCNTPIQDGETRFSMTQYCAGGLMRWVKYGYRSVASIETTQEGPELLKLFDEEKSKRREHGLSLFSKYTELNSDSMMLRKKRHTK